MFHNRRTFGRNGASRPLVPSRDVVDLSTISPDGLDLPVLIDPVAVRRARAMMGADHARILRYFHDDALSALMAIEAAARDQDAARLVGPAHRLKGDAGQVGAVAVMLLAEEIELAARECVERRTAPADCAPQIARLRPILMATLNAFERPQ